MNSDTQTLFTDTKATLRPLNNDHKMTLYKILKTSANMTEGFRQREKIKNDKKCY